MVYIAWARIIVYFAPQIAGLLIIAAASVDRGQWNQLQKPAGQMATMMDLSLSVVELAVLVSVLWNAIANLTVQRGPTFQMVYLAWALKIALSNLRRATLFQLWRQMPFRVFGQTEFGNV